MKLFIINLLIIFSHSALSFCVQTLNTYGLRRKQDPFNIGLFYRTQALRGAIQDANCEVNLLQEVWQKIQRETLNDLHSDHRSVSFSNEGTNIGLATIINDANSQTTTETFVDGKPGLGGFTRNLIGIGKGLSITDSSIDEVPVKIVNVHFMHMKISDDENEFIEFENTALANSIQTTMALVNQMPFDSPVVLAGDINQRPDSIVHQVLKNVLGLNDAYQEVNGQYTKDSCTYCSAKNPLIPGEAKGLSEQLDYIYYRSSSEYQLSPAVAVNNLKSLPDENCLNEQEVEPPSTFLSRFTSEENFSNYSDHYGVQVQFDVEKSQRLINEAEFEKRRQEAIKTLEAVILRLNEADEMTLHSAHTLLRRLRDNDPNDPFIKYLH